MGKLPYGVPNRHVSASHGADTNLMKFYSTQNSTTYGSRWAKFEPRTGKHTGTGYLSNFRPGVYYSGRLDQLDNPAMGYVHISVGPVGNHRQFHVWWLTATKWLLIYYNRFERGIKNLMRLFFFTSNQFFGIIPIIFFFQIPVPMNCSSFFKSNCAIYFKEKGKFVYWWLNSIQI